MNVFDIIGPVMIGPSSSHTAGAVRIGRVANKLMDGKKPASLEITLSGSFARTYRGHGTDRALLAGIMGYHSWSEEIRDALQIAEARGIRYSFLRKDLPDAHPNTARIVYTLSDGTEGSVQAASVGGGNIRVDLVNDMKVDFSGDACAIAIANQLGLVCDPVAGLVEIPCIKRNVSGLMIAFSSADMALAGIPSRIPVDECIDAMREVGDAIPASLRETAGGGLAATPTGKKLQQTTFVSAQGEFKH